MEATFPGSLEGLRTGTHGRWRQEAIMGPKKKPRASRQTMAEILERSWVVLMWFVRWEITAWVAAGSRNIGNMSAKS